MYDPYMKTDEVIERMEQCGEVIDLVVKSQCYLKPKLYGMPRILRSLLITGREVVALETPSSTILDGVAEFITCVDSEANGNIYVWTLDTDFFESDYYAGYRNKVTLALVDELSACRSKVKDLVERLNKVTLTNQNAPKQ